MAQTNSCKEQIRPRTIRLITEALPIREKVCILYLLTESLTMLNCQNGVSLYFLTAFKLLKIFEHCVELG